MNSILEKNLENNSIAVLCRGNSLHHIDKIPVVDEYVLVNRFGDELEDEKLAGILEDKPLARALIEVAEIGFEVPQMFFMAIAEILAKVFQKKNK